MPQTGVSIYRASEDARYQYRCHYRVRKPVHAGHQGIVSMYRYVVQVLDRGGGLYDVTA